MSEEKFIQKAIKHKGSLHRYAKKHHTLNEDGKINLIRTRQYALTHEDGEALHHRLAQVRLAETLADLREAKGTKSMERMP